ncbi:hypothetical protein [Leeuwenhoekiella aequorea]|uniref:Uncharacterized protein n=1 Tax=Leeuwenhoekiella aequorea TaxID=283736 RepID=A0A4Q0P392_9FLAO|nr:hypothetical protein [Leeuwenhoekiella aequorea]RXG21033.1 hypothetical protein DSM00_2547 [Leeuwenhoekiella aequorea]|tara:strand:+ start:4133 stop:5056 length:924 start_codon:yes stop_codon:yes gene_type:complete
MSPVLEIYKELDKFDNISDKLDCLSKYHLSFNGIYRANYNSITEGNLSIHQLVKKFEKKHFPDTKNIPEFTFWFLKFNALKYCETYLLNDRLTRRLNSEVRIEEATIELEKIEKAEKLAHTLVIDNDIDTDLKYKDEKGYLYLMNPKDFPQPEYQTKEIRRVLNGYYESNPTEHAYTVAQSPEVKIYAKHIILKGYLKKLKAEVEIVNDNHKLKFDPNYFNKEGFNLFLYLLENYSKTTINKYSYIWFFLKNHNPKPEQIKFLHTQTSYKEMIDEKFKVSISYKKAGYKWEEDVLPTLKRIASNFFH